MWSTRFSHQKVAIPERSDRRRVLNPKVTTLVTFGTLRYGSEKSRDITVTAQGDDEGY